MKKHLYLECVNAKSKKFYDIELMDNVVIIQYGRINRNGKELIKRFGSEDEAEKLYEKQINNKLKKYKIAVQKYKQLRFSF